MSVVSCYLIMDDERLTERLIGADHEAASFRPREKSDASSFATLNAVEGSSSSELRRIWIEMLVVERREGGSFSGGGLLN